MFGLAYGILPNRHCRVNYSTFVGRLFPLAAFLLSCCTEENGDYAFSLAYAVEDDTSISIYIYRERDR